MAQALIHLDASFLIRAASGRSHEETMLTRWLEAGVRVAISSIAWAEFLCGPVAPRELELAGAMLGEPENFTGDDARLAARLFNRGGRRKHSLADCMIAAVAIRLDASLATVNRSDFRRLGDLRLAD